MKVERIGANHHFIMIKESLFEEYKKDLPLTLQPKEESYKPILDELSRESDTHILGASLERISRQQIDKISLLMKQAIGKNTKNKSLIEYPTGKPNHNSWINTENKCNLSTLEDYIKRLGDEISQILKKNPTGTNIISLHQQLSDIYGEEFNPKRFGSENLVTFLVAHYHKILDIKKAIHSPTGVPSIFVFPKGTIGQNRFAPKSSDQTKQNLKFGSRGLKKHSTPFKQPMESDSIDLHNPSPGYGKGKTDDPDFRARLNNLSDELRARQLYLFKSDLDASFAKEPPKRSSFAAGIGGFSAMVVCDH